MFEFLLLLTAAVLSWYWLSSYRRCRDALHPAIYILPMMALQYVVRPWFMYQRGELQRLLSDSHLELSAFVHLIGVWAFCVGCLPRRSNRQITSLFHVVLRATARQNLVRLAMALGTVAVGFYYYSVFAVGGIAAAYSRPKGGGMRLSSGYFGEAIGLCLPAVVLLIIAWENKKLRLHHYALTLFFASPYLLTGFLGTRRGPMFMILGGLAFTWLLVRTRRVSLIRVLGTVAFAGFVVVLLFTNRPRIYVGSERPLDWRGPIRLITGEGASEGDDYVVATANIAVLRETEKFAWGRRFLITFFVRPIPKQLWPTKYQDAERFLFSSGEMLSIEDFKELLGWVPLSGSAIGGIADLFKEFSWLVIGAAYLYGYFYRILWERARGRRGIWVPLYILAASLSIYIPTQSASAVFHRFLFMGIPLTILWQIFVGRPSKTAGHLMARVCNTCPGQPRPTSIPLNAVAKS